MRNRDTGAGGRALLVAETKRTSGSEVTNTKKSNATYEKWLNAEGMLRQDLVAGLECFGHNLSSLLAFLANCKFSRLLSPKEASEWAILIRALTDTATLSGELVDQAREMDEAQFLAVTPVESRYTQ